MFIIRCGRLVKWMRRPRYVGFGACGGRMMNVGDSMFAYVDAVA